MKLFENGIGRPSNEIKKKRKIFIASVIVLCVALISAFAFTLTKVNTNRLKGASNGNLYMNMSVKNWSVTTNGCKITIPIDIKNTKSYEIKITGAKITYSGSDTPLDSVKLNKTLSGNTGDRINVNFDMSKFTSLTESTFKVVVYFTRKGKEYYKYDLYDTNKMTELKECKKKVTCPEEVYVGKEFKCTANDSSTFMQFGAYKSLASGYGMSSKGTLKLKVKEAGTYVISIRYPDNTTDSKTVVVKEKTGKKTTTTTTTTKKATVATTKKGATTKKASVATTKKTTVKSTAKKKTTKKGATTKKVTTTKKVSSSSSTIRSYNINYAIPKVTKTGNNGEKKIEFKITNVGKKVKYYKHIICFERDACIGKNGDESRYKGKTDLFAAKKDATSSLDIITTESAALLNQGFYVRVETYDKDKKFLYYKTHHVYTNQTTLSTSRNKNISDESKVQIGDFTGATFDFLFSLKSDKVKSTYQANYGIPSVKKLSEVDIDNGVKKSVNIAMHDFGDNVKYVSFAICMKEAYCKRNNTLDYIAQNPEYGSVLLYQVPEHGKEFPIEIITENHDMLNQKFYVRVYSYDVDKKLLFSKIHEFTTGKKTKLGYKKDSEIKVGDRVVSDVTKFKGSKKYYK